MLKYSHPRSVSAKFLLVALLANLLISLPAYAVAPDPDDVDGDGMPTVWEDVHCTDFEIDDTELDQDEDGLTNLEEYTLTTDSCSVDTDGDGLSDGDEVNTYGTDPLVAELPDLTVSNVQLWSTADAAFVLLSSIAAGTDPINYTFYYTVENLGLVDVGAADATVIGFTNVTQDGPEVIAYDWTGIGDYSFLTAGGTANFSADEVTVDNPTLVGATTLIFCVDSTGTIEESDETNNCFSVANPFQPAPAPASSGGSGAGFVAHHDSDVTVEDISADVILTSDEVVTCGEMPFVDVATDDVSYNSVYHLWCEGVIHGRDATHYAPADPIRRDEVSKITARLFGYATMAYGETPELSSTSFTDLSTAEPLAYYVQILTDNDFFFTEKNLGVFRPHDQITYGEATALLTKVSGSKVSLDGYESTDLIDRGTFATLAYTLFE